MPEIRGVDVSKHQPVASVPWSRLVSSGRAEFAFIRSAFGTGFDPSFDDHCERAQEAGVPILGAYHAARPSKDVEQQANMLVHACGEFLVPILDLEIFDDQPAQKVADFAMDFIERVEASLQRKCVFYSYPDFASRLPLSPELASRPLWIAHYGAKKPRLPKPWLDWTLWQYDGDRGERAPNGLDLDFSLFRGTTEELRAVLFQRLDIGCHPE